MTTEMLRVGSGETASSLTSDARTSNARTSKSVWTWVRLLTGAAILAVLVWQLGTGPFLDGIKAVDAWSLTAAAAIAALTTVCCAWRWRLVAQGVGVEVSLGAAVAAYYRSQFLNTMLPGGVLGDVHRGVSHGREVGDLGRSLRAVGWERSAGQVVQAMLTVIVLLVLPSPVGTAMPVIAGVAVVGVLAVVLLRRTLGRAMSPDGSSRWARSVRTAGSDIRNGLLARRVWPGIVLASAVVVIGQAIVFLIAARAVGVTESPTRMLPLALLVLLAMAVPTNVGGWGPREGMAAWAFTAAGLSAAQGVAAATAYGVMVLVASLPGAVVLITSMLRSKRAAHG
jgi:uncharacterized membrane protein YbhN (UPF0104 family)